jgi:hypothetical protein
MTCDGRIRHRQNKEPKCATHKVVVRALLIFVPASVVPSKKSFRRPAPAARRRLRPSGSRQGSLIGRRSSRTCRSSRLGRSPTALGLAPGDIVGSALAQAQAVAHGLGARVGGHRSGRRSPRLRRFAHGLRRGVGRAEGEALRGTNSGNRPRRGPAFLKK